ncbi:ComF family protein [Amycolatopsis cihanbeyliensis]|uniref:Putative amidophosphoribosyltransferase n=1 Tax=Amycolatopsis cihanbeyliensis TaxID=1128664 RepID=A0A542DHI5_AMYCI|nr:ComF family protein [Amycolatopsis cihanbeyliensis]TQJ02547.1 putative amidophosphoribosyltransferase [Amycolatopsis cihanbeyliensis]
MAVGVSFPSLGRAVIDLILPARCAGCGELGAACCTRCRTVWQAPRPVARGPTVEAGQVGTVYALARYTGVPRRLVLAFKERGRRDLARPLGEALAGALPYLRGPRPDAAGTWWLVPAPSRAAAARSRGGSHLLALAGCCAAAMGAAGLRAVVAPALSLARGARDAVGLDHRERAANLAGRMRLHADRAPPAGTPLVLLDDVLTTGATARACVAALSAGGLHTTGVLVLTAAG